MSPATAGSAAPPAYDGQAPPAAPRCRYLVVARRAHCVHLPIVWAVATTYALAGREASRLIDRGYVDVAVRAEGLS